MWTWKARARSCALKTARLPVFATLRSIRTQSLSPTKTFSPARALPRGPLRLQSNKVALTFDDGPDPEWTPKILDVLKREHATATFFLIGIQTDNFSGLAKRIYNEGHTIGNHTFTHPDVSNISATHLKVELNLTERLFASLVGVRVTLLRPPYAIDEEPDTADQVRPLEFAQDHGLHHGRQPD
jgi:peptidoglycan/xylan/chitin deacetylase (PgdA/CDA1 family)